MWKVARRPRWIATLVLVLAVAAAFVLLSQWQLSRSIERAVVFDRDTESYVALESVAEPQAGVTTEASGQLVQAQGVFVDGDFSVLSGRINHGVEGYWLVGHALLDDGTSLAVALGWAPTEQQALAAIPSDDAVAIRGRYLATEPSGDDDFEAGERSAMAVATLINEWDAVATPVYGGYVVLASPPAGVDAIDSPAPTSEVVLNWLNVFYAVEWVVFAGFALFLWYRFVRDAWEREQAEAADLN